VGAVYADNVGALDSGAGYVFRRNEGGTDNWGEICKLTASDAEGGDYFGNYVSISGSTLLIAAPRDDDQCPTDPGCDSGSAWVFTVNENIPAISEWGQFVMLLLVLTAGTLVYARRRSPRVAG